MHQFREQARASAAGKIAKAKGGTVTAEKVDGGPSGLTGSKSMPGAQSEGSESFAEMRVSGRKSGGRLDRKGYAFGGAVGGGSVPASRKPGATVNVIVAPQGAQAAPPQPPAPPPMPMAPPPGPPPGGPPGMPPGLGGLGAGAGGPPPMPMGPPPGSGPPMLPGRSRGGPTYASGGAVEPRMTALRHATPPGLGDLPLPGALPDGPTRHARGGKVYPKMDAGAGSGPGRLEKIDEYGGNAGKVVNRRRTP